MKIFLSVLKRHRGCSISTPALPFVNGTKTALSLRVNCINTDVGLKRDSHNLFYKDVTRNLAQYSTRAPEGSLWIGLLRYKMCLMCDINILQSLLRNLY
jgi:hypothetical protein